VFFPFLPEAPYAQIQVAMTHYKEMAKPDRDRSEAKSAEEEFQTFLAKYPEGSASAKGAATLARCTGSAGGRRLQHWLLLLRERRQASFCRQTALCNQALSSLTAGPTEALWIAGRYF